MAKLNFEDIIILNNKNTEDLNLKEGVNDNNSNNIKNTEEKIENQNLNEEILKPKTKNFVFSLVYKSGPDFAIRKENINNSFLLSVLITKKQVIIINEVNNTKETIISGNKNEEIDNEKVYSKIKGFFRGAKEEIKNPENVLPKNEIFNLGKKSTEMANNLFYLLKGCKIIKNVEKNSANFYVTSYNGACSCNENEDDLYNTSINISNFVENLLNIGLRKNIFFITPNPLYYLEKKYYMKISNNEEEKNIVRKINSIMNNEKEFEKFCNYCFSTLKKWDIVNDKYNLNKDFIEYMLLNFVLYITDLNKDNLQNYIKKTSLFVNYLQLIMTSWEINGIKTFIMLITEMKLNAYDSLEYITLHRISIVNYKDLLDMEKAIYDKILEPYPRDFDNMHDKCSKIMLVKQEEISQKLFEKRYEELKKYEVTKENNKYSSSKYYIFVPKTKDDMLIEAIAQSNCLASYVKKYSMGSTDIFFMREKDSPDKSLVTIEVRDGHIRQALRAHNKNISSKELEFIKKWAKDNDIIVPGNISTALCV